LLTLAGGTSFATPIFAGMVALLNQKLNYTEGQGLINPRLYQLAAVSGNYTSGAIHDVTSGNNNCNAGATKCGTTTGGFSANVGYDEVTGIGSLDLAKIAAVWPANTGASATLIGTGTTVSSSNPTPAQCANVTFTSTVAASSGPTPTGTVTLQGDGGTIFGVSGATTVAAQPLAANGTLTYMTSFTASGPHTVLAQYSGDATHVPSVGQAEVIVPSPIVVTATDVSVTQGTTGTSTITVTPNSGYTGTVDLSFTTSNNTALANLCYSFTTTTSTGIGTVAVTGASAVTTTLSLDTKASDCVKAAAIKGPGQHAFKALHASNSVSPGAKSKPGVKKLPAGIAFMGLLLVGFLARGSRKLRSLACLIAIGVVGMALTSCGGGGGGTTTTPPTNPAKGTYTITLTGTDSVKSTISSTTTFTFTIN
jgi:hypothetical protein